MRRLNNQKGSFMVFLTLSFALLGTFIGFAIDFGHAYLEKARISRLVDGAALASAKALKGQSGYEDEATRAACDSMVMNGAPVVMDGALSCTATTGAPLTVALSFFDVPVEGGPPIKHVSVTGIEPVSTTFLNFLSWMVPGDYTKINVSAMAEAAPERPIDLMLVLDRSGSMGCTTCVDGTGTKKITALKTAVNAFLGLSNTFSSDDRIGLVSFASRGCGNASGQDSTSTTCTPDMALDYATSSYITSLQNKVNGLCNGGTNCSGGTNTMEAFRTARPPLASAFNDVNRSTTRKAILFVTDGQPTYLRRENSTRCKQDPLNNSPFDFNPGTLNGCAMGVAAYPITTIPNAGTTKVVYSYPLTASSPSTSNMGCSALIPGYTGCNSGNTFPTVATNYLNFLRCARSIINCQTNGAMFEANVTRNCGFGNSACASGGAHDIVIFTIAIGKEEAGAPQSSMDKNAKCLLARMSNAEQIMIAATGVIETLTSVCTGQITTIDGDTHADLNEGWPPCGTTPCIDGTQEKGRVSIVDSNGNVQTQLQSVFDDVAKLLKLRLVL